MERLGDQDIEDKYKRKMSALAVALDHYFNGDTAAPRGKKIRDDRETGFVLLVFPFGDAEGRCNFISNGADRKDIVNLFKEMIARFEGQPEITGHG